MEIHVLTPRGSALIMLTQNGRVVDVWPAPPETLPTPPPTGQHADQSATQTAEI